MRNARYRAVVPASTDSAGRSQKCPVRTGAEPAPFRSPDKPQALYTKVPERAKAKLKAATEEYMQTLGDSPERVKTYFQGTRVKYAA